MKVRSHEEKCFEAGEAFHLLPKASFVALLVLPKLSGELSVLVGGWGPFPTALRGETKEQAPAGEGCSFQERV